MLELLDLKEHEVFLPQYVALRNSYIELLLTDPVTVGETEQWIRSSDVEILIAVENGLLQGAVLLYMERSGEIAFFAREQCRGIGTKLLYLIETVARARGISEIWAWVREDNPIAQRVFEKIGYHFFGRIERSHRGNIVTGIKYTKKITEQI